ncbi:hypothetical protein BDI4_340049 [Burkholderia diffusa]|nr:hypothetical protein BDI4_340049 [Burkholderia diffusa]
MMSGSFYEDDIDGNLSRTVEKKVGAAQRTRSGPPY